MENNMYTTFMFYNEQKKRLSIFAEREGDILHITVIPCSRKDQFSRKVGREEYAEIVAINPTDKELQKRNIATFNIGIKDKQPGKTFINWCKEKYYKKYEATSLVPVYYLAKKEINGDDRLDVLNNKFKVKKPSLKLYK